MAQHRPDGSDRNIFTRREITALERAELQARWVEIVAQKVGLAGQHARGGKQPKDKGISRTARDLGLPRKIMERAVNIAKLEPEGKEAARALGQEVLHHNLLRRQCLHNQWRFDMKCKTLTARIIRLWPYDDSKPVQRSYSRDDSPISFAEDILRSLPEGQFLIEVWNGTHIWTFETRLASTWRAGVPVRSIH